MKRVNYEDGLYVLEKFLDTDDSPLQKELLAFRTGYKCWFEDIVTDNNALSMTVVVRRNPTSFRDFFSSRTIRMPLRLKTEESVPSTYLQDVLCY